MGKPNGCMEEIQVPWVCLKEEWVRCNSDGALKAERNRAGCGGVCRDYNGRWLYEFSKYLGSCNALMAEL